MNEILDNAKNKNPEDFESLLDTLLEMAAKSAEGRPDTVSGMGIRVAWEHKKARKVFDGIFKTVSNPDNFAGIPENDAAFIAKQKAVLEYFELMQVGMNNFCVVNGIAVKE